MKIQKMFLKEIDRPITGVVKVGQIQEQDKKQELEEYVVTRELTRHFIEFFDNYAKSIKTPTDEMGVWISGFFGSGKSHFLKILSYVLDDTVVDGRHAMEYLKEKEALASDPMLMANMTLAADTPTQAILFNVDSKSTASAKSDSNAIVLVFNRVFNEKLGYIGAIPALADLERELDEEGRYQEFQDTYNRITGNNWLDSRHKFKVMRGKVANTLVDMGYMSKDEADIWIKESSTGSYQISISDFADRVSHYIDRTGRRVVFLVDEIGQFISSDSQLMLNLQTMTEELGTRCRGKAWVIVTAQEDIDSMTENMQERSNDFSKIQGRFGTRLSLSSVNADEVIRERILKKNETGTSTLEALYETNETTIQNVVDFKETIEMKKVANAQEFAAVYPFLPYQFNLLADVLNAIRLNSSTGKHLSEGERSMLGAYQKAAVSVMNEEEGVLVPFYRFYDDLVKFLDHTHAGVIQRAEDNDRLNPMHDDDCFTINVLKTLFLLKYVNGVPLTVGNIVSLMVTNINEDRISLHQKVEDSLLLLTRNLLVSQIQDTYEFLTDEEQDINRAIRDRNIQSADVITAIAKTTFDTIYNNNRYRVPRFNGRYTFAYNQTVDNRPIKNNQNNEIGLRLITPYFGGDGGTVDDTTLSMMSAGNREVIMKLPVDNNTYYTELQNALRIEDYIRDVADPQKGKSTAIRATKVQEAGKSRDTAVKSLKEAIGEASIFINGSKTTGITTHEPTARINAALEKLVETVYYKLSYIDVPKDDLDTRALFSKNKQTSLSVGEAAEANSKALKEMREYISISTSSHTMVSLKSLIDHFTIVPYGYLDSDVKWLAAKLFHDGEVSATVDKEPVTMFNREPDDLGNYFTSRKFEEKVLLRSKETIEMVKIKDCKDVIKAFFNHTETTSDADKLLASFKSQAKALIVDCNDMLKEQQMSHDAYPGKETLETAIRHLTELSAIDDTATFFKNISANKGDLLDLAEDLTPVCTFYNSDTQKKIFEDNGLRAIYLYENSKEHINNADLESVIDDIRKIVQHKTPYEMIRKLPSLYLSFTDGYSKVLADKLNPVLQVIDQDKQSVLNLIKDQPYEGQYSSQVTQAFDDLSNRASREQDISNMLGFKDKADSLCRTYLNKFTNMTVSHPEEEPYPKTLQTNDDSTNMVCEDGDVTPQKRIKNLIGRDITSNTWVINNKEDLDAYLEKVRKQIEAELEDNDMVLVTF